jgi:hypothetical protein
MAHLVFFPFGMTVSTLYFNEHKFVYICQKSCIFKVKRLAAAFLIISSALLSCGKSIEKNSFEGRAASFISDYRGVNLAISLNLKNILDKSGIYDGAIPYQYLESIQPYIDALQASVNLNKQLFFIPLIDLSDEDKNGGLILFEVQDLDRLRKEFKEMGFHLKKNNNIEYGIKGNECAGIFLDQTGFVLSMADESLMNQTLVNNIAQSLDAGKTVDGVIDFVNMNSDIAMFYTGDKTPLLGKTGVAELDALSAKISDITIGTFCIGEMIFRDQEAVLNLNLTYGKILRQYLPLLSESISSDAMSVLVNESAFGAFAINTKFEKIMDLVLSNLDVQERERLDKKMSIFGGVEKVRETFTGELSFCMKPGADMPKINAFVGLNDKKQLKSLLDGFGFFLGLKKNGDGYELEDYYLQFSQKGLLLAMSQQNLKEMLSNRMFKTKNLGNFQFGKAPVSLFLDMKQLAQISAIQEYADVIQNFDYLTFEMYNNQGKMIVKSTKNDQNILRTLVMGFIKMQQLYQIRQGEMQQDQEAAWDDEDWDGDFSL